jgi:hypothetical protein
VAADQRLEGPGVPRPGASHEAGVGLGHIHKDR